MPPKVLGSSPRMTVNRPHAQPPGAGGGTYPSGLSRHLRHWASKPCSPEPGNSQSGQWAGRSMPSGRITLASPKVAASHSNGIADSWWISPNIRRAPPMRHSRKPTPHMSRGMDSSGRVRSEKATPSRSPPMSANFRSLSMKKARFISVFLTFSQNRSSAPFRLVLTKCVCDTVQSSRIAFSSEAYERSAESSFALEKLAFLDPAPVSWQ